MANERQRWEKKKMTEERERFCSGRSGSVETGRVVGVATRQNPSRHCILVCNVTVLAFKSSPSQSGPRRQGISVSVASAAEIKQSNQQIAYIPGPASLLSATLANHSFTQDSGKRRRRLLLSLFGASGS